MNFFTIFANLPPPSKCRLVQPAPPHLPRYASAVAITRSFSYYSTFLLLDDSSPWLLVTQGFPYSTFPFTGDYTTSPILDVSTEWH